MAKQGRQSHFKGDRIARPNFGEKLRRVVGYGAKVSQSELGNALGVTFQQIQKILRRASTGLSAAMMVRIRRC